MIVPRRHAEINYCDFWRVVKETLPFSKKNEKDLDLVHAFEEAFAKYLGCKHAVATGSGRSAFHLILEFMQLEPGSEVVIPAYTLKDLIQVIEKNKLKAVPADVELNSFNLAPESVVKRFTTRTKVIIATHMFGNPCAIEEIVEVAGRRGIHVIEDCAHSLGSDIQERPTGTFGIASFFSFETIKLLNAYGGGMIVTNDDHLARFARTKLRKQKPYMGTIIGKTSAMILERFLFASHLAAPFLFLLASPRWKKAITILYRTFQQTPKSQIAFTGIQAQFGIERLNTLRERIGKRRARAERMKWLLPKQIQAQAILPGSHTNYYFFVALLAEDAEHTRRLLLRHGFDAGIKDEITDHCAAALGYVDCPNTNIVYERAIHLPIHEGLSVAKIERLASILMARFQ